MSAVSVPSLPLCHGSSHRSVVVFVVDVVVVVEGVVRTNFSPVCVSFFFFSSVPWGRGETVLPCSGGGERRKTQESQLRLRSFLRASFSWGKEDCLSLSLSLSVVLSRGRGWVSRTRTPAPRCVALFP